MNIFKILLIPLLFSFFACQQQTKYQEMKADLTKTIQGLQSELADSYQKKQAELETLTNSEIEKFSAIEYRVFELIKGTTTEEHQQKLNEIGKERWDCFFIDPTAEFYRVYCRRIPKSYLRYLSKIPNLIP